jgi:hypothetical protein
MVQRASFGMGFSLEEEEGFGEEGSHWRVPKIRGEGWGLEVFGDSFLTFLRGRSGILVSEWGFGVSEKFRRRPGVGFPGLPQRIQERKAREVRSSRAGRMAVRVFMAQGHCA